jgi:hypothetical protein
MYPTTRGPSFAILGERRLLAPASAGEPIQDLARSYKVSRSTSTRLAQADESMTEQI